MRREHNNEQSYIDTKQTSPRVGAVHKDLNKTMFMQYTEIQTETQAVSKMLVLYITVFITTVWFVFALSDATPVSIPAVHQWKSDTTWSESWMFPTSFIEQVE